MATLSLLCRLKVLSVSTISSSNELSRFLLIKSKEENERSSFWSNNDFIDVLDETKRDTRRGYRCGTKEGWLLYVAKDVPRYESLRRILLTINREKNTSDGTSMNKCMRMRGYFLETTNNVQSTSLFDKRSPIVSPFSLATIYHSWKLSKEPCPSTGHFCSPVRKLSNSTLRFSPPTNDPIHEKFASRNKSGTKRNPCHTITNRYSFSEGPPCKKESKSEDCPVESTSEKQELFQDICSKTKPDPCETKVFAKECPDSSRPCKPLFEDPPPICTTSRCPNIQDYCQEQESYQEKFWQALACFIGAPLFIITSIYVYSKVKESRKRPRPEFEDVPWMRRIVKPFPWGDGKHTLFHNPVRNPISPHGYEVEDPNAVKNVESKKETEN